MESGQRWRAFKLGEMMAGGVSSAFALQAKPRLEHGWLDLDSVGLQTRRRVRKYRGHLSAAARATRRRSPTRASGAALPVGLPTATDFAPFAALHAAVRFITLREQKEAGTIRRQQQQQQKTNPRDANRRHAHKTRKALPRLP
jgi:hypothetical protein